MNIPKAVKISKVPDFCGYPFSINSFCSPFERPANPDSKPYLLFIANCPA